jgi:uncharacterized damage-inducible protein DinB
MATPDELRAALEEARKEFRTALPEVDGAWEQQPASGEGEEAWSPRQVAQHVVAAEAYFTTAVCTACGYPGVDQVNPDYANATAALSAFDEVVEMCNKKLKYVTETDLEKTHERWGNVEQIMQINAGHLRDHAAQMRAAAGVG